MSALFDTATDDDREAFESFGPEVPASEVPALVRAGREVWSFGYGADDDDCGYPGRCFTTLEADDLALWDDSAAEAWGPFRVTPL